jgi:hypothetical protein
MDYSRMTNFLVAILTSAVLVSGCASIVSNSLSSVRPGAGQYVSTTISATEMLYFQTPDELTPEQARSQLMRECGGNELTGVTTSITKRDFVLFQIYTLRANAICLKQ